MIVFICYCTVIYHTVNAPMNPGGGGGGLNFGPSGEGGGLLERAAYLKFFDRQRQNYTMSMEFEMSCSLTNTMNSCVIYILYI